MPIILRTIMECPVKGNILINVSVVDHQAHPAAEWRQNN